ncbi:MAG TPA: hypothetical protein VM368_05040, partial [Flavisolibacter sp.]|nr:hypothetical protein [Flavisolibacter sp.]
MEENDANKIPEESFSDDSTENLRMENEILKLKMQAEHGAVFGKGEEDIPPEVENEFLQQVQQFEDAWQNMKYVKVYDKIGRPPFKKEDELDASEIVFELKRITSLMNDKDIFLDVLGEYEPRVIYKFITEELFEHDSQDMMLPGWSTNFIYEEFHPNHKMDILKSSEDFLRHWFDKQFDEYALELNNEIITADGRTYSCQQIKDKLNDCLAFYKSFSDINSSISEINFEWDEAEDKGIGHAEGFTSFYADLDGGETIHIEGSFKLYMSNEDG